MPCFLLFAILIFSSFSKSLECAEKNGQLKIVFDGIESTQGHLRITVNRTESEWKDDALAYQRIILESTQEPLETLLPQIPYGEYSVRVFQDLNDNQKLDTNFIGIPTEPIGISNNVKGRMGPPPFQKTLFSVNQPAQTIHIDVKKIKLLK